MNPSGAFFGTAYRRCLSNPFFGAAYRQYFTNLWYLATSHSRPLCFSFFIRAICCLFYHPICPLLYAASHLPSANFLPPLMPLFLEQFLVMLVGLADTLVISYAGESAVSGVSLVNQFNTIFIYLFTASLILQRSSKANLSAISQFGLHLFPNQSSIWYFKRYI